MIKRPVLSYRSGINYNVTNVNSDLNILNLTCISNRPCLGNAFVVTWIAGVTATWFDVTNALSFKLIDFLCFYGMVFSRPLEYLEIHKINNILQGLYLFLIPYNSYIIPYTNISAILYARFLSTLKYENLLHFDSHSSISRNEFLVSLQPLLS